jgi:hypothetical protein
MHRVILSGQLRRWYLDDLLPAATGIVVIALIAKMVMFVTESRLTVLLQLVGIYVLMMVYAVWRAPYVKSALLRINNEKSAAE